MRLLFDPAKDEANILKHGITLEKASVFDWETALIVEDTRKAYGEPRFIAQGYINKRLHILIFTPRGNAARIISLRKSNARERSFYEAQKI